jgi:hypothetical protein
MNSGNTVMKSKEFLFICYPRRYLQKLGDSRGRVSNCETSWEECLEEFEFELEDLEAGRWKV